MLMYISQISHIDLKHFFFLACVQESKTSNLKQLKKHFRKDRVRVVVVCTHKMNAHTVNEYCYLCTLFFLAHLSSPQICMCTLSFYSLSEYFLECCMMYKV